MPTSYIPQFSNYNPSMGLVNYGTSPSSSQIIMQYGAPQTNIGALSYTPQSYTANNVNSYSSQFSNFGANLIPSSLPISITPPLSSSSSISSGYTTPSQSIQTLYQPSTTQWSNSGIFSNTAALSQLPTSYIPNISNSSVNSGLTLSGISSSSLTSSTTIGQATNIQTGSPVISSSTATEIQNSQNRLIQNVPNSPNTISYQVTSTTK
jgi:hypothetical protein